MPSPSKEGAADRREPCAKRACPFRSGARRIRCRPRSRLRQYQGRREALRRRHQGEELEGALVASAKLPAPPGVACWLDVRTSLPERPDLSHFSHSAICHQGRTPMAKGQQRSNKEKKKPKQKKVTPPASSSASGQKSGQAAERRAEPAALCPHGPVARSEEGSWLRIAALSFLLVLLSCSDAGGRTVADRHGRRRDAQFHARGAAARTTPRPSKCLTSPIGEDDLWAFRCSPARWDDMSAR